eukprot:96042-Ditylum_brightwellii.AAC.2
MEQFIGHLQENILAGQQLQILLNQVKLVSGSACLYLEDVDRDFDYVPSIQLKVIHDFLKLQKAKIRIKDT